MAVKLVTKPTQISKQGTFERNVQMLGVNAGMLAFDADGSRYLNEHVQWLWATYLSRR